MEINIDNEKNMIENNNIIDIGNGWKTFEYSKEDSPSPKLYYFKKDDVDLKAITFDKYVELLTEGETIEGMLKKLNLKIDEYCEKQEDPKPKICTEKENIQELNIQESIKSEDFSKQINIINKEIEKHPSILNILKFI